MSSDSQLKPFERRILLKARDSSWTWEWIKDKGTAHVLVKRGLLRAWGGYHTASEFQITDAGREALEGSKG